MRHSDLSQKDNISYEAAQRMVLEAAALRPAESVAITDAAGTVLADDVPAAAPLPFFDNSAMDGYGVRSADTVTASEERPVRLRLVGQVRAGEQAPLVVGAGETASVMTGAPIPRACDAVVRREDVRVDGDWVRLGRPVPPGESVRFQGEEIAQGALALRAGTLLTPAAIGFLSALGVTQLRIRRFASVSIVVTGDELVDLGDIVRPGQVIDANSHTLAAALSDMGAHAAYRRRAPDDRRLLRAALSEGLAAADVLLVSGGVSVGDYDFVKELCIELGVQRVFWGVRQRPGHPLFFGRKGERTVFGLPGNPVSALACFYEYVWPFLRQQVGLPQPRLATAWARLGEPVDKPSGRTMFLRAHVEWVSGAAGAPVEPRVTAAGGQGSHMQGAFAQANALAVLPAHSNRVPAGTWVECHLLPWYGRS